MGKLAKSLKHSIWYASKILNGTRYAEQNKEVRGTPWGEGGIASVRGYTLHGHVIMMNYLNLKYQTSS